MDGSIEQVDKFMDWAADRNIEVLIDVHTARDSQNGFDNSGQARSVVWNEDGTKFQHWEILSADWMGEWSG